MDLASVAWTGDGRPAKRIVDAAGSQICRSGAWAPLLCQIPATGQYYLETWRQPGLLPDDQSPYRVSLRQLPEPWYTAGGSEPERCDIATVPNGQLSLAGSRAHITDHAACHRLLTYNADPLSPNADLMVEAGRSRVKIVARSVQGPWATICDVTGTARCAAPRGGWPSQIAIFVTGAGGAYAVTTTLAT